MQSILKFDYSCKTSYKSPKTFENVHSHEANFQTVLIRLNNIFNGSVKVAIPQHFMLPTCNRYWLPYFYPNSNNLAGPPSWFTIQYFKSKLFDRPDVKIALTWRATPQSTDGRRARLENWGASSQPAWGRTLRCDPRGQRSREPNKPKMVIILSRGLNQVIL